MALTVTVDDKGSVLELIQEDSEGLLVRENGDWTEVNTDDENPTIFEQEWIDVSDDIVDFWDDAQSKDEDVTKEDIEQFRA
jgi:hypothetical protein